MSREQDETMRERVDNPGAELDSPPSNAERFRQSLIEQRDLLQEREDDWADYLLARARMLGHRGAHLTR